MYTGGNISSTPKTTNTENIPVYDMNEPNAGPQKPAIISNDTPVYSCYTGKLIGYGSIKKYSIKTDAPFGSPNYDKYFHVIQYNPANGSWMSHNPNGGQKTTSIQYTPRTDTGISYKVHYNTSQQSDVQQSYILNNYNISYNTSQQSDVQQSYILNNYNIS
jgi:hypothetical protein